MKKDAIGELKKDDFDYRYKFLDFNWNRYKLIPNVLRLAKEMRHKMEESGIARASLEVAVKEVLLNLAQGKIKIDELEKKFSDIPVEAIPEQKTK